jgi:hypothetical protein
MEREGRTEFKVVLDLELSPEQAVQINQAVQRAAMHALADIDLEGDFRVFFPGIGRRPLFPWGIWIGPLLDKELGIPAGFEER